MTVNQPLKPWPKGDPVRTEEHLMNVAHSIRSKSASYLALPWAHLINRNQITLLDRFKEGRSTDEENRQIVITSCQHIRINEVLSTMSVLGVTDVLSPHCTYTLRDTALREYDLKVHPIPHFPFHLDFQRSKRKYLYSFCGHDNHSLRSRLGSLNSIRNPILLRKVWQLGPNAIGSNRQQYRDILESSIFSLCPRGTGPGSLRLSEAILAGSIPVVLSDDLILPRPLEVACIRIPEKDWKSIPKILASVSQATKMSLISNGAIAIKTLFRSRYFCSPCFDSILHEND